MPDLFEARIDAELAGAGNGWTEITDVLQESTVVAEYGIRGSGPTQRVAERGSLKFSLDNAAETNSGSLLGYYALLNANKRSGFALDIGTRLVFERNHISPTTEHVKFLGKLKRAVPVAGVYGERVVPCEALDWFDVAARIKPVGLDVLFDVRSDQVFQALLDAIDTQPAATDLETGKETWETALDQAREDQRTVRDLTHDVCMSELGYCYQTGPGTVVLENRHHRALNPTVHFHFDDDVMNAVVVPGSIEDVVRKVQVFVRPTRVDGSAVVLFNLQTTSTLISPGETNSSIFGGYRDPDNPRDRIGGTDMVNPVATTDYTMNSQQDGGGIDLTANFTVTASFTGSGVRFTITNNGGTAGYVTMLRVRGKGIYRFWAVIEADVPDAIGDRVLEVRMPFQNNVNVGQSVAEYYATLYESPLAHARALTFICDSDEMVEQALDREPGDRIKLSETVTGLSEHHFTINGVRLEIRPGPVLWCTWYLEPALATSFWILGVSTLGVDTVLGF